MLRKTIKKKNTNRINVILIMFKKNVFWVFARKNIRIERPYLATLAVKLA
jgi:hypothetical protein